MQRGRCARRRRLGVAEVRGPRGGAMRRRRLTPASAGACTGGRGDAPRASSSSSRPCEPVAVLTLAREVAEREVDSGEIAATSAAALRASEAALRLGVALGF